MESVAIGGGKREDGNREMLLEEAEIETLMHNERATGFH